MSHSSFNYKPYYGNEVFRFTNKGNNLNERLNFEAWYKEQIQLYGQEVEYYVYNYSLTGHDPVYGEQPATNFLSPVNIIMLIELSESSLGLSKFGLQAEDDVTAFVSISSFRTTMSGTSTEGVRVKEPKAGDVFKLSEYGDDRPLNRDGKMFEITQRIDQEVSIINPLMGHYVWQVMAKRLDYTFEPGLTAEKGSDQVYDSSFAGRLSGGTHPPTDTKTTTDDINAEAKKVFDYDSINDADDVYGDYY